MARDEAYQEAERRIEAARREGATELYLGGLGLTELPEAIAALTQLQSLDLSDNQLTEVPEAIAALTQLQTLNLFSNQLTELPEAIASLTQLQSLDLSYNQLTELPEAIASLTQLQELNFGSNQLTGLPEAITALTQLQTLDLSDNQLKEFPDGIILLKELKIIRICNNELTVLPDSIADLIHLEEVDLAGNRINSLPSKIQRLKQIRNLYLCGNPLKSLPEWIRNFSSLEQLYISIGELPDWLDTLPNLVSFGIGDYRCADRSINEFPITLRKLKKIETFNAIGCSITELPEWLGELTNLQEIYLQQNRLTELPSSLGNIECLQIIQLDGNPLNVDLTAAQEQGVGAVKQYLQSRAEGEIELNLAKLILVGEGEVGKSCLLGALRGDNWVEGRPTTHGIEIKPVIVNASNSETEITFNGWDFGGQRVYRPTHQLFFSSTAVYLVVWKPREGPQQGFVKEWITLIKHREPDAKVLVVATHGGPGQRQPDIDRQELIDLFGRDTVLGFHHIDSKEGTGIAELREAIANTAATLPGMGRKVPTKWQQLRELLEASGQPYQSYDDVIALCEEHGLEGFAAELFVRVSHTLGYLIHYHYDEILKDTVILQPDWLAKAISFVLDDDLTRDRNGLVEFDHLSQLWSHPPFKGETGYPPELHPVFLRLMERFDLSYKVVLDPTHPEACNTHLIAQLVPDQRPEQLPDWSTEPDAGDHQQVQICRIVDDRGQSANAEGLFYQLIVRLHKYSLGRDNYNDSVHWQRGLMLDNDYNGRALLEHIGNDVKITVRAALPGTFLAYLTQEIKWLVQRQILILG